MSNGPLPTRLLLLSDLPSCSDGGKVRFLGCVSRYEITTGTLCLEHAYPNSSAGKHVTAAVDVNLLLGTLKYTDTQIGEWVNVMGYVQRSEERRDAKKKSLKCEDAKGGSERRVVKLQAVMLWSAGGIKVWQYEKALEMRKKVEGLAK
ncbi:MAG: hypothetical protein Q9168_001968 [Polycauliona sp. 1 TL-2023]